MAADPTFFLVGKLSGGPDAHIIELSPIPRTLHMSLIGIRDMSVLEEPPMDHVPIQTYVMEYNDELVREAINRGLSSQDPDAGFDPHCSGSQPVYG